MEAPQNLVDAVNRIRPRVILVLDTNVIMNNPRLDRYEISETGPFLLVVPNPVNNEIMRNRKNKDRNTRRKARNAYNATDKLYKRGNPTTGISLGSSRWLVTANVPGQLDEATLEDEQVRGDKGKVDAALLRMTAACKRDFPDVSTLFVTEEHDLRYIASTRGFSACRLSDLRSPEIFENIFRETRPIEDLDIEDAIVALLDPKNKQTLKIALTLEELRSEGDNLVARGSGGLTYDGKRYPFRWTFPYQNLAIYNLLEDDVPIDTETAVMPLENVDFMGVDDKIPEVVMRYVCSMLEDAYGRQDLQSPLTKVRARMLFASVMGFTRGELLDENLYKRQRLTPEEAERYDELRSQHNRHVHSLFYRSVKNWGSEYRSVFRLSENVDAFPDHEIDDYDGDWWDLETALIEFLDDTLGTWAVGETREEEFTYRPFAWPEDEAEAVVDDNDDDLEEEAFVDDEDDSGEESA